MWICVVVIAAWIDVIVIACGLMFSRVTSGGQTAGVVYLWLRPVV